MLGGKVVDDLFGFIVWYIDRKSTRLNSSHLVISYAVFCLKKKKNDRQYDKDCGEPVSYSAADGVCSGGGGGGGRGVRRGRRRGELVGEEQARSHSDTQLSV